MHLLRARSPPLGAAAAIAAVFDEVDLLLTPTTATTAFVAEGPPPIEIAGQEVGGMGSVPFTAPFNISGMPGGEHPGGPASTDCPSGCRSSRRRHEEELVLACGARRRGRTAPGPSSPRCAYSCTRTCVTCRRAADVDVRVAIWGAGYPAGA